MIEDRTHLRGRLLGRIAALALTTSAVTLVNAAETPTTDQTSAQPASGAISGPGLQEIVVTARRQREKLGDVPVAVSAFTATDLRENRVESVQDLQNYVPSMNVATGVTQNSGIQIRGMGATGGFGTVIAGGGTGVVSYFDDAVANMSDRSLYYDLEDVQVVEGPQGTLFGKNTTGGVVLFVPKAPDNTFGGYVDGAFGNYELAAFTGAINVPIIDDKLMVRVAAQHYGRDGYTIDRGPIFPGKDYDNQHYSAARVSILFRPTAALQNSTVLSYFESNENGPGFVLSASSPLGPFASLLDPYLQEEQAAGARSTSLSADQIDKRQEYGVINTTKWSVAPGYDFKNIFSYQVQKWQNAEDLDASPYIVTDLVGTGGWHLQTGTFTEEPQLQASALGGNLHVTVGGYYEYGHNIANQPYQVDVALGGFTVQQPLASNYERSRAVYGQSTFDFGELAGALRGLKLTGGYRYTRDAYGYGVALVAAGSEACISSSGTYSPPANDCQFSDTGENSGSSWTLGLDYHLTPSTLVYVRSGHGYIPGGFNPAVAYSFPGGQDSAGYRFAPESDTDVELGTKWEFMLGSAPGSIDADVFHTSFKDIQRIVFESININQSGIPSNFTTNASAARIQGFELQASLRPLRVLKVALQYSWDEGRYTQINPVAAPSLVGIPFANLPKQKASVIATYFLPVPERSGILSVNGSYSYQSTFYDGTSSPVYPLDFITSYRIANMRLDWDDIYESSVDASVFVTNLGNTLYRTGVYDEYASLGYLQSQYGPPRMYGIQLRYTFGGG
jgi:iron complex outermembrane receptor protein